MEDVRLKLWSGLEYKNPGHFLRLLRPVQFAVAASNLPEKIKSLRTHNLRRWGETRDAALVTYGISKVLRNESLEFAMHEDQDYDFVARRIESGTIIYTPVQLKVLVPSRINPNSTLEGEIQKLEKYSCSGDLVVVIRVSRDGPVDYGAIKIPKLPIAQLWVLGTLSPDQSRWCIVGDLLDHPEVVEFEYPGEE